MCKRSLHLKVRYPGYRIKSSSISLSATKKLNTRKTKSSAIKLQA